MSTESDSNSSSNNRELKLMQQIDKLKNELSELKEVNTTNERLTAEKEEISKEFASFKKEIDTKEYFKKIGGKEDYLDDFKKLWEGDKMDDIKLKEFKEKRGNMFEKEEIKPGSPTNSIAGESKGDGSTESKDDGAEMVFTKKDGGIVAKGA